VYKIKSWFLVLWYSFRDCQSNGVI